MLFKKFSSDEISSQVRLPLPVAPALLCGFKLQPDFEPYYSGGGDAESSEVVCTAWHQR